MDNVHDFLLETLLAFISREPTPRWRPVTKSFLCVLPGSEQHLVVPLGIHGQLPLQASRAKFSWASLTRAWSFFYSSSFPLWVVLPTSVQLPGHFHVWWWPAGAWSFL